MVCARHNRDLLHQCFGQNLLIFKKAIGAVLANVWYHRDVWKINFKIRCSWLAAYGTL